MLQLLQHNASDTNKNKTITGSETSMTYLVVECGVEGCDGVIKYDEKTEAFICSTCGALHEEED